MTHEFNTDAGGSQVFIDNGQVVIVAGPGSGGFEGQTFQTAHELSAGTHRLGLPKGVPGASSVVNVGANDMLTVRFPFPTGTASSYLNFFAPGKSLIRESGFTAMDPQDNHYQLLR